MCTVSMVHDYFEPMFPNPWHVPTAPIDPTPKTIPATQTIWSNWPVLGPGLTEQLAELKAIIADFREAVEAARKVDILTAQPDCVDPEKAKLEGRVAELERQIKKYEAGQKKPAKRKPKAAK